MATFRLADVEKERAYESFELELESGEKIEFPHPRSLNSLAFLRIEQLGPIGTLQVVLGEEAAFKVLSETSLEQLEKVLEAYMAHFGLGSPGEGRASRGSSSATARPSKRTSRSRG